MAQPKEIFIKQPPLNSPAADRELSYSWMNKGAWDGAVIPAKDDNARIHITPSSPAGAPWKLNLNIPSGNIQDETKVVAKTIETKFTFAPNKFDRIRLALMPKSTLQVEDFQLLNGTFVVHGTLKAKKLHMVRTHDLASYLSFLPTPGNFPRPNAEIEELKISGIAEKVVVNPVKEPQVVDVENSRLKVTSLLMDGVNITVRDNSDVNVRELVTNKRSLLSISKSYFAVKHRFVLDPNSEINVWKGGFLHLPRNNVHIHFNAKLIINDGGALVLNDCAQWDEVKNRVELKKGGKVLLWTGNIYLPFVPCPNALPKKVGAFAQPLCPGVLVGNIDLSVEGGNPPYTFAWSNGATTEDLSAVPAGEYTVTVSDQDSVLEVHTATLSAVGGLSVESWVQDAYCGTPYLGGVGLQLLADSVPVPATFVNSLGDSSSGFFGDLPAGSHSFTAMTAEGCTLSTSATVDCAPLPEPGDVSADFAAYPWPLTDSVIHAGDSVLFYNLSSGAFNSTWQFGDGSGATESSPFHVYAQPGTYFVSLMIDGCCTGLGGMTMQLLTVLPADSIALPVDTTWVPGDTTQQHGGGIHPPGSGMPLDPMLADFTWLSAGTIAFYPAISGGIAYHWDFGDGTTSSLMAPQHSYVQSGFFTVCLTVTYSNGSATRCHDVVKAPDAYPVFQKTAPVAAPASFTLAPNPVRTHVEASWQLAAAGDAALHIWNSQGQRVHTLTRTGMEAGSVRWAIDLQGLTPGVYVVELQVNGQRYGTRRLMVAGQ